MKLTGKIIELETIRGEGLSGEKFTTLEISLSHKSSISAYTQGGRVSKPGKLSDIERACVDQVLNDIIRDAKKLKRELGGVIDEEL